MKNFLFVAKTPEKFVVEEEIEFLVMPTSEGEFGVLANHEPCVLWVEKGFCVYTDKQGEKKKIFVMEGVADITRNKVTLLSDFMENERDLEKALAEREKYYEEEKKRRRESYLAYKQSGIDLRRKLKDLNEEPRLEV